MRRGLSLLVALAAALAACKPAPKPPSRFETFKGPGGAFTLERPAAWHLANVSAGGPEQALFLSPAEAGPGMATLWVRHYPAGDPVYKDATAYAAAQTAPGPGREVETDKKSYNGRQYRIFKVTRPLGRSPEGDQAPPRVYEAQAVLDHGAAFYILGASRPLGDPYWDAHPAELDAYFERLLESFESAGRE